MMLAWLTDIHLNFLEHPEREAFYAKIVSLNSDALVISGDIAEADSVVEIMQEMAEAINLPIYFVLGNHDYYRGDIATVKQTITFLCNSEPMLHWLPAVGIQKLTDNTVLVGQDGWADARYGDYVQSKVMLNDSRLISDLFQQRIIGKYQLQEKMQQLADKDAEQLQQNLTEAIEKQHPQRIIILTHVPPFREACLYEGEISDDDYLPFFASKATGDVLLEAAECYSDIEFMVLCGHTHGEAELQVRHNLIVKVGGAEYYSPAVQDVIAV